MLELLCRHHHPGYLPRDLCALDRGVDEIKAYIIVPAAVEDWPLGGLATQAQKLPRLQAKVALPCFFSCSMATPIYKW
jgi:hypothetical protein